MIRPHRIHHVLIAGGHGRGRPPHEAHDGSLGDTEDEQHGGGRVAGIAKASASNVRLREECLPLSPVSTVGRTTAKLVREHQPVFLTTASRPQSALLPVP